VEEERGAYGPVIVNEATQGGAKGGYHCQAAELSLLELDQKGIAIKGAKMLATCVLTEEEILMRKSKLISVGSRACNQIPLVSCTVVFPILHSKHPLTKVYLEKADQVGLERTVSSLHRI
jgi:hypothetical protein